MTDWSHRIRKVHWQNDMLVEAQHFRHEQDYVEDLVGWGLVRSWGVYGLARTDDGLPALKVTCERGGSGDNSIVLTLSRCCGITPGGHRVLFRESDRGVDPVKLEYRLDSGRTEGRYDVYLVVDVAAEIQGTGDHGDVPLGMTPCELRVESYTVDPKPRSNELLIGQVYQQRNGEVGIDDHYIPPCVGIRSHSGLQSLAESIANELETAMEKSLRITHYASDDTLTQRNVDYEQSIVFRLLCDKLSTWIGSNIDVLRFTITDDRPPVELYLFCKQFIRLFNTILGLLGDAGRKNLFQTWAGWNKEFNPHDFSQGLTTLLSAPYEHARLGIFLNRALGVLEPFVEILKVVEAQMDNAPAPAPKPEPAPEPPKKGVIRGAKRSPLGRQR